MAGMGPPPKKDADRRRRNATVAMTMLPPGGRKGRVPKWPISEATAAELALWAELWRTPQAVAWERMHSGREVAQYVRFKIRAEDGALDEAKEARQLGDRLGLTPLAMLRLRWEIAPVAEAKTEAPKVVRRLRAVDPVAS